MPKRSDPPPDTASRHGFVRLVPITRIGDAGLTMSVAVPANVLAKIASYLDLELLQALRGEIQLSRWRGRGVLLTGHFAADVTQACVVTLEPVAAHLEGDFERRFLSDAAEKEVREIHVEPEGEDPAEPLAREIDIGEILVEELSLALDPYPRKEGVAFAPEQDTVAKPDNPFAVLTKLQGKKAKAKPKP